MPALLLSPTWFGESNNLDLNEGMLVTYQGQYYSGSA
jgi:hypothetical protein